MIFNSSQKYNSQNRNWTKQIFRLDIILLAYSSFLILFIVNKRIHLEIQTPTIKKVFLQYIWRYIISRLEGIFFFLCRKHQSTSMVKGVITSDNTIACRMPSWGLFSCPCEVVYKLLGQQVLEHLMGAHPTLQQQRISNTSLTIDSPVF